MLLCMVKVVTEKLELNIDGKRREDGRCEENIRNDIEKGRGGLNKEVGIAGTR